MNILRNEARSAYIKLIFNAKSKQNERNVDLNGYYEIRSCFVGLFYYGVRHVSPRHRCYFMDIM